MTAEQALSLIQRGSPRRYQIESFSEQYKYFRWLERLSRNYPELDYIMEGGEAMENCPSCGLAVPIGLRHESLDHCQIALVAAQDAVRMTIDSHLNAIEEKAKKLSEFQRRKENNKP